MARLTVVVSILYACSVFGSIAEAVTPVRLVNGRDKFEGAVEVLYKGQWGKVCADRVTQETVNSICYMIYNGSIPHGNMSFEYSWDGDRGYDYMITNLHCSSSEEDIFFCDSNEWLHTGNQFCSDGRLILGCHTYIQEHIYGAVTFSFDRQNNYTICRESFDKEDAEVICRTRGLSSRNVRYYFDGYGYGTDGIMTAHCSGDEDDLSECYMQPAPYYCRHSQDVRVECDPTEVRLQQGFNDRDGVLEVYYNGVWGRVCVDGFGPEEAQVACGMINNGTKVPGTIRRTYDTTHYRRGHYGGYMVNQLDCTGSEEDISLCTSEPWNGGYCSQQYVVSLDCNTIRLANGNTRYEGRVEVFDNSTNEWGTVCDDSFDNNEARVICSSLGLSQQTGYARTAPYGAFPAGRGDILLDDLHCTGYESDLTSCSSSGWGRHNCGHGQDAGVYCTNSLHSSYLPPVSVRLVDGSSYSSGRVEVHFGGSWGTICGRHLSHSDVQVICREAGHYQGYSYGKAYYNAYFGKGEGNVVIEDLQCNGTVSHLHDCMSKPWLSNTCSHDEDFGVDCYAYNNDVQNSLPINNGEFAGAVRLMNGHNNQSGRVEVFYDGQWGTICDYGFDMEDAVVICKLLGMYHGRQYISIYRNAHFGGSNGPYMISNLRCAGYEWGLSQCPSQPWLTDYCGYTRGNAGIDCGESAGTTEYPWGIQETTYLSGNEGQVRLVGGSYYYGRVEVYSRGQWGTICDDGFDYNDVQVICRMLGFYQGSGYGIPYSNAHYGGGHGAIIVDGLNCNGYEQDIKQCSSNPWFSHDCDHSEDAGLNCYGRYYDYTTDTPREETTQYPWWMRETTDLSGYEGQVRLVDGSYYYGRVEVYSRGQWGTICDDSFDYNDVKVICRSLGLYQGTGYGMPYSSAYYGEGHGSIIVDELNCNGYEQNIKQCLSNVWFKHDCGHSEDAGVNCYERHHNSTTPYQVYSTATPWWYHQTTTGYRIQDAIFVNCNEYGWDIQVDMNTLRLINPTAKASDIYLGENSCNGVLSWNTLTFNQGLRECLTSEMVRNNELVYRNELVYAERDPLHSFIIRHYNWTVGVECDVQRNETSSGHLHHISNQNTLPPVSGNSHFFVNMSFYSDPNFQYVLQYPLSVSVGQNVYAKIFTTTSDWTIRMRVHTCYTKPSEFAPDHLKYYIIKNGCEVDSNTHIISQSSHETRIVFQDFEYTSSHEGLYVFCDANFCSSQDYSRNCQQTCNPVVRRILPHRPASVTEDPIGSSETTEMNIDDLQHNNVTL